MCRRGLAGPRTLAGDKGQQLRRAGCHCFHGDRRDRERQRRAVGRSLRPESCGVSREVPAGRGPGRHSAVRAIRFSPFRVAALTLLHRVGGFAQGPLQQCLLALPLQEGGLGRLWEALCAEALKVRSYGSCLRRSRAACRRKKSWCKYQWLCAADGLRRVSHCSTTPPAWAALTRRCRPRVAGLLDVPAREIWACG